MQEDELRKINNFILYIAKGHPQALEALYENIGGRMLAVAFFHTPEQADGGGRRAGQFSEDSEERLPF